MQKNGERACSPFPGGVRDGQRPVAAAGLHADRCRTVGVALSIDEGEDGCARACADDGARRAISALRLPADCDLPRTGGSHHELRPVPSAVAAGEASGATQATEKTHCHWSAAAECANRCEPVCGPTTSCSTGARTVSS